MNKEALILRGLCAAINVNILIVRFLTFILRFVWISV